MLFLHVNPKEGQGSKFLFTKTTIIGISECFTFMWVKDQCHIDNIEDAEFIIDNMKQLPEIDDDTLASLALL